MEINLFIITFGRVLQIAISLISVRIFTSLLSHSEVGNLYLINAIFGFFGLALLNPVGMFLNRKLNNWVKNKVLLNRLLVYRIYLLALAGISMPIVYLMHRFGGVGSNIRLDMLIAYLALMVYFFTWNQTVLPTLNMLGHRTSFVLFSTLTASLGLAISVFLVKCYGKTAVIWLSGPVISQMLVTFIAARYLKKFLVETTNIAEIKKTISAQGLISILSFTLPLSITTFFMWAQNQSYRLVIEKTVGLSFLGAIGLGMAIASSIATAAETVLQQLYLPQYYRDINTENAVARTEAWSRLAQATLPVYMSITILVSFLAPCLMAILASKNFQGAYVFVIYGAWIELSRMVVSILSNVAHAEMKTKFLMKAYCLGGLAVVAGTFLAARQQNYEQLIPLVLIFGGFLTVVVMYFEMKRLMPFKLGIRKICAAVVYSVPISGAYFFYGKPVSVQRGLFVAGVFGTYWLFVQYSLFKKTRVAVVSDRLTENHGVQS